jgi:hypothetical protein
MTTRVGRRLALVVASAALALPLGGCLPFTDTFWQCLVTGHYYSCMKALIEEGYIEVDAEDPDADGHRGADDHCPVDAHTEGPFGCPDGDGDGIPDHEDDCPGESGPAPSGCPPPPEQPPSEDRPSDPPPTEPAEDTTAPAAPTGLTASATLDRVTLDWADNAESDVRGYHVERATGETGTFERLTTTPLGESEYVDESVEASTTYRYVVRAADMAGNVSEPSEQEVVTSCPSADCLGRRATARAAGLVYRVEVTGRIARKGTLRAADGVAATITGLVFAGRLRVFRAPAALRRASWKGRMTMTLVPSAHRAAATGVVVARFRKAGRVCLRVEQEFGVDDRGRRTAWGTLTALGARGRARRLGFAGRFSGTPAADGAWRLRATATGRRRLPRALPRRCRI